MPRYVFILLHENFKAGTIFTTLTPTGMGVFFNTKKPK